ncbi:MAG: flagellar basal body P-ring formation chaperone FlgA [Armatimonadota bacterium]
MKRSILILLLTACTLTIGAVHAAQVKVTLRPESQVQPAHTVTVGDIASIEAPKAVASRIGGVTIATAPLPGQQRMIKSSYIKLRLKSIGSSGDVKLIGPDEVAIVGECVKLSSDELADEAKSFVLSQLQNDSCTYEVTIERAPRELTIAAGGNIKLKSRFMGSAIRRGVNTVMVDVQRDGRTVASVSTPVMVKSVAQVLIATSPIRQGEALTASNTALEQREVTNIPDAVGQDSEATQWIARRSIKPGCIIVSSDVVLPPTVKKGDSVSLVVRCGNITLRTNGEVKQDGRVGDTVRVISAVSQSEVRARVVEPGLVEINS